MTSSDYHGGMKRVGVAALKARLSEYLRIVRRGGTVVVLDRDTPIARIVPAAAGPERLEVRPPAKDRPPLHELVLPSGRPLGVDVVAILREERQADR